MNYFDYLPELSEEKKKELFCESSKLEVRAERLEALARYKLTTLENISLGKAIEKISSQEGIFSKYRKVSLGITGEFTFEHLKYNLLAAGFRKGILFRIEFAPFNSIYATALDKIRPFSEKMDYLFICPDPQHFYNSSMPIAEVKEELLTLCSKLKQRYQAEILLANAFPRHYEGTSTINGSNTGSFEWFANQYNSACLEISTNKDAVLFDVHRLSSMVGVHNWLNPIDYYRGKFPFAFNNCDIFADYLVRSIASHLGVRKKIAVLDLDGVLWGGILGDDKDDISIGKGSAEGEAFSTFQNFILNELYKTGVILAAASKNDSDNVEKVLSDHPEMLLRNEHFAVLQINWKDKVSNIRAIAKTLNCGLDSIVFIDDSIQERTLVRELLPEVATLELGDNPVYYPTVIANSGYFDYYQLSVEDMGRTESYINNLKRVEIKKNFSDYSKYLRSLEMNLLIAPVEKETFGRVTQLFNKTNQFNLMQDRLMPQEIERLSKCEDRIIVQVSLSDKLERYGLISVLVLKIDNSDLYIDSWVMSCRVFNRDVENALLNFIIDLAQKKRLTKIVGRCKNVSTGSYVHGLFQKRGFVCTQHQDNIETFEISTDVIESVECSISNIIIKN